LESNNSFVIFVFLENTRQGQGIWIICKIQEAEMVCEGNWYHFFVVKSTFDLYFSPLTHVQQKCSCFSFPFCRISK